MSFTISRETIRKTAAAARAIERERERECKLIDAVTSFYDIAKWSDTIHQRCTMDFASVTTRAPFFLLIQRRRRLPGLHNASCQGGERVVSKESLREKLMMTDPQPPFSPKSYCTTSKENTGNMVIALDSSYHQTPFTTKSP
jgi:hypothetical protein